MRVCKALGADGGAYKEVWGVVTVYGEVGEDGRGGGVVRGGQELHIISE